MYVLCQHLDYAYMQYVYVYSHYGVDRTRIHKYITILYIYILTPCKNGTKFEHYLFYLLQDDYVHIYIILYNYIYIITHTVYSYQHANTFVQSIVWEILHGHFCSMPSRIRRRWVCSAYQQPKSQST